MGGSGRIRNNPQALLRIAELLDIFRSSNRQIIHIRHASLRPGSRFRADLPGFAVRPEGAERIDEPAIVKQVNSAFIGTSLELELRRRKIETLFLVGATTNHCVETTTRMAGNLGFDARLVSDATWAFDHLSDDPSRPGFSAELVHQMTLENLRNEFAEIVRSEDVCKAIANQANPL